MFPSRARSHDSTRDGRERIVVPAYDKPRVTPTAQTETPPLASRPPASTASHSSGRTSPPSAAAPSPSVTAPSVARPRPRSPQGGAPRVSAAAPARPASVLMVSSLGSSLDRRPPPPPANVPMLLAPPPQGPPSLPVESIKVYDTVKLPVFVMDGRIDYTLEAPDVKSLLTQQRWPGQLSQLILEHDAKRDREKGRKERATARSSGPVLQHISHLMDALRTTMDEVDSVRSTLQKTLARSNDDNYDDDEDDHQRLTDLSRQLGGIVQRYRSRYGVIAGDPKYRFTRNSGPKDQSGSLPPSKYVPPPPPPQIGPKLPPAPAPSKRSPQTPAWLRPKFQPPQPGATTTAPVKRALMPDSAATPPTLARQGAGTIAQAKKKPSAPRPSASTRPRTVSRSPPGGAAELSQADMGDNESEEEERPLLLQPAPSTAEEERGASLGGSQPHTPSEGMLDIEYTGEMDHEEEQARSDGETARHHGVVVHVPKATPTPAPTATATATATPRGRRAQAAEDLHADTLSERTGCTARHKRLVLAGETLAEAVLIEVEMEDEPNLNSDSEAEHYVPRIEPPEDVKPIITREQTTTVVVTTSASPAKKKPTANASPHGVAPGAAGFNVSEELLVYLLGFLPAEDRITMLWVNAASRRAALLPFLWEGSTIPTPIYVALLLVQATPANSFHDLNVMCEQRVFSRLVLTGVTMNRLKAATRALHVRSNDLTEAVPLMRAYAAAPRLTRLELSGDIKANYVVLLLRVATFPALRHLSLQFSGPSSFEVYTVLKELPTLDTLELPALSDPQGWFVLNLEPPVQLKQLFQLKHVIVGARASGLQFPRTHFPALETLVIDPAPAEESLFGAGPPLTLTTLAVADHGSSCLSHTHPELKRLIVESFRSGKGMAPFRPACTPSLVTLVVRERGVKQPGTMGRYAWVSQLFEARPSLREVCIIGAPDPGILHASTVWADLPVPAREGAWSRTPVEDGDLEVCVRRCEDVEGAVYVQYHIIHDQEVLALNTWNTYCLS